MICLNSYNIISSLGFDVEENFKQIANKNTGISSNNDIAAENAAVSLLDTAKFEKIVSEIQLSEKEYTRYEKFLICSISKALTNSRIDISSKDTVLIFSTTKGNVNLREKKYSNQYNSERVQIWKSSEIVADFFKNPNKPITISNACISGVLTLVTAHRLLLSGRYKHAVVAGADILSEFTLSGFLSFKAVSPKACMPFDKNRQGMTPGEGAACIVLSADTSLAGENPIYLAGGASSNDANHISGPSRTGAELSKAIQSALDYSNLSPSQIDYISAHGTATLYNDEMEAKALSLSGLQNVPVNSFKSNIGHTFGAAGIIETILAAETIKRNILLPSRGFEIQGTSCKLNIIKEKQPKSVNNIVKTASGFGGCNAALILTQKTPDVKIKEHSNYKIAKTVSFKNFKIFENNDIINYDFYEDIEKLSDFNSKFSMFSKSLYKNEGIKYPKFHKMDRLCKLAFLGTELLLKDIDKETINPYSTAVFLSNGAGSSDTDAEYQKTIDDRNNYFPSPKLFVYTLANIMTGEISIRHGLKGENTVFIEKEFDKKFIFDYAKIVFEMQKADAIITGRINFDPNIQEAYLDLYYLVRSTVC